MRDVRRKQQDLAFANRHIDVLTVLHSLQQHVAFELIEELFARIDVKVLPRIGTADHHDDELAVAEYLLVADRRLQQVTIFVDPAAEIEGSKRVHTMCPGPDSAMVRIKFSGGDFADDAIRFSLWASGFRR